jgi:hypothetical protein
MYIIEIFDNDKKKSIKKYESTILPMIGDWYNSFDFEDNKRRVVTSRLLYISDYMQQEIVVCVDTWKP